jgi:hypothetical protein
LRSRPLKSGCALGFNLVLEQYLDRNPNWIPQENVPFFQELDSRFVAILPWINQNPVFHLYIHPILSIAAFSSDSRRISPISHIKIPSKTLA